MTLARCPAPRAAAGFAQDAPSLELGAGAFAGSTELGVGAVGGLGEGACPSPCRGRARDHRLSPSREHHQPRAGQSRAV